MLVVTEINTFIPRLYKGYLPWLATFPLYNTGNDVDADMEISSEQCQSKKHGRDLVSPQKGS